MFIQPVLRLAYLLVDLEHRESGISAEPTAVALALEMSDHRLVEHGPVPAEHGDNTETVRQVGVNDSGGLRQPWRIHARQPGWDRLFFSTTRQRRP